MLFYDELPFAWGDIAPLRVDIFSYGAHGSSLVVKTSCLGVLGVIEESQIFIRKAVRRIVMKYIITKYIAVI